MYVLGAIALKPVDDLGGRQCATEEEALCPVAAFFTQQSSDRRSQRLRQ